MRLEARNDNWENKKTKQSETPTPVQRMDRSPRETIFMVVLDAAYPRLTLNHGLTFSLPFRPLPTASSELQGTQGKQQPNATKDR